MKENMKALVKKYGLEFGIGVVVEILLAISVMGLCKVYFGAISIVDGIPYYLVTILTVYIMVKLLRMDITTWKESEEEAV